MIRKHAQVLLAAYFVLLAGAVDAAAGRIDIDPPGDREFIVDLAEIIEPGDETEIRDICDSLLTDTAAPIIVVTIGSMAQYGGAGYRIETFATVLFNQWGVGHEKINHGILLLVSVGDRKARIELGAGWGREHDGQAREIMQGHIVSRFKMEDYSGGILAGVKTLDKMARGFKIPAPPRPWWHYALVVGAVVLGIWTFMSLVRNGSSGWAWLLWAVVFSIIGFLLYRMLMSRGRGGGFSGGSFGGGFSGGGGATGSW